MLIQTTLAKARGQDNHVTNGERLNRRDAVSPAELIASESEKARYMLEVAQMQTASGLMEKATHTLRLALGMGCKCRWVAISQKYSTTITEPELFLKKLRSALFLDRDDFRILLRLMRPGWTPADIFESERVSDAVAKVIDSPERGEVGGSPSMAAAC